MSLTVAQTISFVLSAAACKKQGEMIIASALKRKKAKTDV